MLRAFVIGVSMSVLAAAGAPAGQGASTMDFSPIVVEATVPVAREEAYRLWTTKEGLESFFAKQANVEMRPGGIYEVLFKPDAPPGSRGAEGCHVLSFLPGEMLSFDWSAPPQFTHARPQRTWVVVQFTDAGPGKSHVRLTHAGFAQKRDANPGHEEEWAQVRAYFGAAWPKVMEWFSDRCEAMSGLTPDGASRASDGARAMEILGALVGGEWIHEGAPPGGGVFRVRNVARRGPDGVSIASDGWLGDTDGMFPHAATLIWRDPATGEARFQSVHENGAAASGPIRPIGPSAVEWDWLEQTPDHEQRYRITMTFTGPDEYRMTLAQVTPEGEEPFFENPPVFRRVDKAPAEFTRLRTPVPGDAARGPRGE